MVGRERHLGGADQVEVVFGQAVDLAVVGDREAGALHRLGLDQHRSDHRHETGLDGLLHGHVEQPELEPGPGAAQEEEPGARDLGAPLHVDRAEQFAQLKVVARGEVELPGSAHVFEDDVVVLAAVRRGRVDDVGHRHGQGLELGAEPLGLRLGRLHLRREILRPVEQRLPLVAGRLGDRLAHVLLLGAQRLEGAQRAAPTLVEESSVSTTESSSPRARCESRSRSGSSRRVRRSITEQTLPLHGSGPHSA